MYKFLTLKISEHDKHYVQALIVLTGAIFFWRGIWDVGYLIPYLENPFVSMFIGLTILTLSGAIFTEFDPFSSKMHHTLELLNNLLSYKHLKNKKYTINYFDEYKKQMISIPHHNISKLEHQTLVIRKKDKEEFIPVHRIREIREGDKIIWKKGN
ncbi:DUF504 domain-containing protein [Candidatus Woesearchaeota archaeon]|nr:DUF504 domain-containing protein [Candidatus Woesearchaeota archaeon]